VSKVPKVYWTNPDGSTNVNHDDTVRDYISMAQRIADERGLMRGVGVIDFADCTVVVVSASVPPKEVFVADRRTENSIAAGFGYLGDVL
jgi:hypothetical protein